MHVQELTRLSDGSNVFKMIGPALIKQDPVEAKSNVNKRIEYIKGEIERLDSQLKGMESKQKAKETEVGAAGGISTRKQGRRGHRCVWQVGDPEHEHGVTAIVCCCCADPRAAEEDAGSSRGRSIVAQRCSYASTPSAATRCLAA